MKKIMLGILLGVVLCNVGMAATGHLQAVTSYETVSYELPRFEGFVIR